VENGSGRPQSHVPSDVRGSVVGEYDPGSDAQILLLRDAHLWFRQFLLLEPERLPQLPPEADELFLIGGGCAADKKESDAAPTNRSEVAERVRRQSVVVVVVPREKAVPSGVDGGD
jgi:hypothetical protein